MWWETIYLCSKLDGLSLKVACQESLQATAYMVKMFSKRQARVTSEWNTAFPYLCLSTYREGGFSLRMAYQLIFFPNANCVGWSPISRIASCRGFAVSRTWNEFLWHYQQGVIESYYSLLSASELQALIHFYLSQRIQYMNLIFINHNSNRLQLHRQSPSQGWSSDWKHSNKLDTGLRSGKNTIEEASIRGGTFNVFTP